MAAKLLRRYNVELMSYAPVRQLMASVTQNPQNETISYVESMDSVRKAVKELGPEMSGQARRYIIGYLNDVYFTKQDELTDEWWFEMHTRLQKLCAVSMILEGDNLRSFGADPQKDDIPQALIGIFSTIIEKRKLFPALRETYQQKIGKIYENEEHTWYIVCYTRN